MRETFPVLLGTLVSQTLLNLVALALLGVIIVSTTPLFHSGTKQLFAFSLVPLILLVVVLVAPLVMRQTGNGRVARIGAAAHRAMVQVRAGLKIFRDPREGTAAAAAQLGAWAIQLVGLLGAPLRARPRRPGGDRRRRRGPLRGQRHRRRPGDPVEHRRLPAGRDQRPPHRLRGRAPPTRSPTA